MIPANPHAVHIYRNGKHIGRLSTDGSVVRRILFAAMFPREVAEEIAAEINAGENLTDDAGEGLSAKVRPFNK